VTGLRLGSSPVRVAERVGARTHRFEAWFLSGALVSGVAYGMLPMLLPQFVAARGGNAQTVGIVMGCLMVGCLFAPAWAAIADRFRIHRTLAVFLVGLAGITLLWMARDAGEAGLMVGAAVIGTCCTGATVIGGLFVTDRAPRDDWPKRQGVAVMTFATGIGAGLLLAAAFSGAFVEDGLLFGSMMLLLATGMAVVWMPWIPRRRNHLERGDTIDFEGHPVMHQAPDPDVEYREGDTRWCIAFMLFLAGIGLLTTASAMFLFQFPLMAPAAFGVNPAAAAAVFGLAALASVIWYPAVGRTARNRDPVDLIVRATWMRAVVFGELALLSLVVDTWVTIGAAALFFIYRNTWPSVYAGITEGSSELVPPHRRPLAMGLVSAVLALSAISAGVASGMLVDELGYRELAFAVFGTAIVAGFMFAILRVWRRHLIATNWA